MPSSLRVPPSSGRRATLGAAAIITLACLVGTDASAEFEVWYDDQGRKHVSNVPARGFASNGAIRRAYDPNSIVYQHARLRAALAEQSIEAARQREQVRRESAAMGQRAPQTAVVRGAPREGLMNLDELIALEKRGGRFSDPVADQPPGVSRSK